MTKVIEEGWIGSAILLFVFCSFSATLYSVHLKRTSNRTITFETGGLKIRMKGGDEFFYSISDIHKISKVGMRNFPTNIWYPWYKFHYFIIEIKPKDSEKLILNLSFLEASVDVLNQYTDSINYEFRQFPILPKLFNKEIVP